MWWFYVLSVWLSSLAWFFWDRQGSHMGLQPAQRCTVGQFTPNCLDQMSPEFKTQWGRVGFLWSWALKQLDRVNMMDEPLKYVCEHICLSINALISQTSHMANCRFGRWRQTSLFDDRNYELFMSFFSS